MGPCSGAEPAFEDAMSARFFSCKPGEAVWRGESRDRADRPWLMTSGQPDGRLNVTGGRINI